MSDFKLTNITKVKSNYPPPITDVTIVTFMQKLDEIDNECNRSFPLWLIIVITIYSALVASPLELVCIWWKCNKECNQCIAKFTKKRPQTECKTAEIVLIVTETKSNLNVRIWEALEEKGIQYQTYKMCMKMKLEHSFLNMQWLHFASHVYPKKWEETLILYTNMNPRNHTNRTTAYQSMQTTTASAEHMNIK